MSSGHPTVNRLHEWFNAITGDFVCREQVEKFLDVERTHYPADLDAFANSMLTTFVSGVARAHLNKARQQNRQSAFRDQINQVAEGHNLFEDVYVIDGEYTRRRLGDMTADDHRFVARSYESESKRQATFAIFHRAVAKRLGNRLTSDVFTADEYQSMYRSLTASKQAPVHQVPDAA